MGYHSLLGNTLVELGITARARGKLTESRGLLEDALALNLKVQERSRRDPSYVSRLRSGY